jgi:hypothetical protein
LTHHLKNEHKLTVQAYYDSYILKENEQEKICNHHECNKLTRFKGLLGGYGDFCSNVCLTTRKRTKEENEKLSLRIKEFYNSDRGEQVKIKLSLARRGELNPRHKCSKERWDILAKRQSKIMKEKIASGEFTPCVTNSWANSRCKIEIDGFEKKYRSSWDAAFQILNPMCEYEKLRIRYISPEDNDWHNYITDFIDEENKILYEIKPKGLKDTPKNKAKFEAANKWCKQNKFQFMVISNKWFIENAPKINFKAYDPKILKGMKQFL